MAKKKEIADEPLEKQLWKAADKLRKNIDAAEYKHVVLGLIFLQYISVSFEDLYNKLKQEIDLGADPEDREEYKAENVFYVPAEARWSTLVANAKDPKIGKLIDEAMDAIEKDNPSLKGVLPKVFARPNLDPTSLGELVDLIGNSTLNAATNSADLLGHMFEYFLGEFALAEGKKGGQFYTPRSVVELLVNMLEPYKGRVLDPCCGSGGMFVQSEKFVEQHQGRVNDISIFGQESNQTTWRLCKMNLAIRGIDASQVKWNTEGSFLNDAHRDVKVDYVIANPPFNDSDWSGDLLRSDGRWKYGVPPAGNANFAWIQHLLVNMLEPYKGRVLDPCCGSGGMFVQSEKFVEQHQGRVNDISIFGQESNQTTWRLCKMNLAIRGIDASQVKWNTEGSFLNDAHRDVKVDYVIANPPFNDSDWSGDLLRSDGRWKYGVPPAGNANFAWIQHFIYHLAPAGQAGFVLAKGALTSKNSGEGEIRKNLVDAGLVDCIVNLPAKLFLNTQIPASLWFLSRSRCADGSFRERSQEILFIDARNMGHLINRRTREFSPEDIKLISDTYHQWRNEGGTYQDVPGFCASVPVSRVAELDYVLTPGRYVGLPEEDDDFNFEERFTALKAEFEAQLKEEERLNKLILENLAKIK